MSNRDAGPTQGNPSHTSIKQAVDLVVRMEREAGGYLMVEGLTRSSLLNQMALAFDAAWLSGFEDGQCCSFLQKIREAE